MSTCWNAWRNRITGIVVGAICGAFLGSGKGIVCAFGDVSEVIVCTLIGGIVGLSAVPDAVRLAGKGGKEVNGLTMLLGLSLSFGKVGGLLSGISTFLSWGDSAGSRSRHPRGAGLADRQPAGASGGAPDINSMYGPRRPVPRFGLGQACRRCGKSGGHHLWPRQRARS